MSDDLSVKVFGIPLGGLDPLLATMLGFAVQGQVGVVRYEQGGEEPLLEILDHRSGWCLEDWQLVEAVYTAVFMWAAENTEAADHLYARGNRVRVVIKTAIAADEPSLRCDRSVRIL